MPEAAPRSGCCSSSPTTCRTSTTPTATAATSTSPISLTATSKTPASTPYYGGSSGFADVFDLIDDACDGLLAHVLDTRPTGTAPNLSLVDARAVG